MFLIRRNIHVLPKLIFYVIVVAILISCDSIFNKKIEKEPIARVGNTFLYKEDVADLVGSNMSKLNSASFVTNYINNWALQQLLLSKAKINLSEDKLASFEKLAANYRADLYIRSYKEALVQQVQDTVIGMSEINSFYKRQKENFRLKEKLVKLRFVELPKQFLNKSRVVEKLKRFSEEDVAYLDSIGVQFKKMNLNDSTWVKTHRIIKEIPGLTIENQGRYLKKPQFFELQDSFGVYLVKVMDILNINDVAPLSFIKPTIEQLIINRRRLDYIRKLETEIIDEAIKEQEFEIYVKDE